MATDTKTQGIDDKARDVIDAIGEVSQDAGEHLAGAAPRVEDAMRRADETLRMSSDETLGIVGAFSVGVAIGLLLGGANRLLIAIALIPAAIVAGITIERREGPSGAQHAGR